MTFPRSTINTTQLTTKGREVDKKGYVYMMTNYANTVLYVGVTSKLHQRVWKHKQGVYKGFTSRYRVHKLVYIEGPYAMEDAIRREKQIKKYKREWKIGLIEQQNSTWSDLFEN
jgi:putative endonuclease